MNNLHITLTEFRNESRLLKEANSLLQHGVVSSLFVAALNGHSLPKDEYISEKFHVRRFELMTRKFSAKLYIQLLKYIEFSVAIYIFYKNKKIKLINVHSLALLPLGVLLKFAYGAKLIYDTHELETEKNGDYGIRKYVSKWVERVLIKYADMTIVVSESIADWYESAYSMMRPQVILNAANRRQLTKTNYFRNDLGIHNDQVIFLYQGGLACGRGVDLILDAFKARIDSKVVIVFMGNGELEDEIKSASLTYCNIFYLPSVDSRSVLEYTASADIGIHLIQNTCLNHEYCMPNKIFEYTMAGLPLLVSNMKDISALLGKYKMGSIIDDFSVDGINIAIDKLLMLNLSEMKYNAYRAACDHSWEIQECKLIAAYNNNGIKSADDVVVQI
jgi:glycosyltransferase involved in cell wall biosynthesis